MPEAIAPSQEKQAVPPSFGGGMVETVTPADPNDANSIAKVSLDYPTRFKEIVSDIPKAADTPEARVRIANNVVAHNEDTKLYRPNQTTQWDKVLVNVLSRNYNEALKWYNGGGNRDVAAKDINNNLYYKEENDFGFTGRVKDGITGRVLSPKEYQALNANGGIFTDTDVKDLKTLPWTQAQSNATLANKGLTSQLQLATNDAYNAATTAGSANKNIDEQLTLTNRLKPVLNHIASLPEDQRRRVLGYVSRLQQIGASKGSQEERGINVNAGGQQTVGGTLGGNIGTGAVGTEGGIPPSGSKINAGGSIGVNTSATNQAGASGRQAVSGTASSNEMMQEQQNLERAIFQELQGVIKGPNEFKDFIRLNSLNAANDFAYKNIPEHVKPPTWNTVPDTDPYTGGAEAMIANRVNQQRNNALMAAWSKELLAAQREMARTGKTIDLGQLADNFQSSEIFQAINNTFQHKMRSHLEGRTILPPKGSLMVNSRNQIGLSPGE
jgi:hypothetical protein